MDTVFAYIKVIFLFSLIGAAFEIGRQAANIFMLRLALKHL